MAALWNVSEENLLLSVSTPTPTDMELAAESPNLDVLSSALSVNVVNVSNLYHIWPR